MYSGSLGTENALCIKLGSTCSNCLRLRIFFAIRRVSNFFLRAELDGGRSPTCDETDLTADEVKPDELEFSACIVESELLNVYKTGPL